MLKYSGYKLKNGDKYHRFFLLSDVFLTTTPDWYSYGAVGCPKYFRKPICSEKLYYSAVFQELILK